LEAGFTDWSPGVSWGTLGEWVEQLPKEVMQKRPRLCTMAAWVLINSADGLADHLFAPAVDYLGLASQSLQGADASEAAVRESTSQLEHLVHEVQNYIAMLTKLISGTEEMAPREFALQQAFWNEIMHEHAEYIEGMLDPKESALKAQAAAFGREFARLVQQAQTAEQRLQILPQVTMRSEAATERIQRFKADGTKGILSCRVRSIINPLLSDHVLREANYYLRMLREYGNMQ
jgi:ATP/maltotriose-dependent transcriptional regulator MalT